MKCISLLQPWATLLVRGLKTIETRSWSTDHRGPIAIHASGRWGRGCRDLCFSEPFHGVLAMQRKNEAGSFYFDDILDGICPLGVVLGTANLLGCVRFHWITGTLYAMGDHGATPMNLTARELAFGDFSEGRYGWVLSDVTPLPDPIRATGRLGLWDWIQTP